MSPIQWENLQWGPKPFISNAPLWSVPMPTISTNTNNLSIEPSDLSGRQVIGKTFLWVAIGFLISILLFVVLTFIGGMFTEAIGQQSNTLAKSNILLPLILLFIWFISTFIGNAVVAGAYSLFFSKTYKNTSKTFWLLLLTNALLFFILAPLYLLFSSQVETLFFILWFHVVFAVFVSSCEIEFVSNPNYSSSALIGNILGFTLTIFMYFLIFQLYNPGSAQDKVSLFMLLPSIIGYTLMPLGLAIWTKIYYKIYEMGNNPFYLPSTEDTSSEESEDQNKKDDEINVSM